MAKGIQPDDETKERVKALLAAGKAKNQIAKEVGLSWATVDKISKEEPDELENIREHKRMEFIERLWNSMDEALKLADKRISLAIDANNRLDELAEAVIDSDLYPKRAMELQRALDNVSSVPLGQISTFIGTIYDKRALMLGQSTANNVNHNMNHDVTNLSPEERRARIDELNRRRGNGAAGAS